MDSNAGADEELAADGKGLGAVAGYRGKNGAGW